MLGKILSVVLFLYGVVGSVIVYLHEWTEIVTQLQYFLIYVVAPWVGVAAIQKQSRWPLSAVLLVFVFISVRLSVFAASFPIVAPISMSITFGDFYNGTGGLIDLFAIIVVILIAQSIRQINNESKHESKPTE